jgi:hypothetical protein
LTDAEIFNCIEIIKNRFGVPPNGGLTYTVKKMADKLGISKRKTERALRVAEEATDETKEQIRAGKTSIHRAEVTVKSSSTAPRPSKEKPKDGRRASKKVEIDPDQWDQLKEIVKVVGGTVEDLVYDALERYLSADCEEDEVATATEQDCDRTEDETAWTHDDDVDDEESNVAEA